MAAEGGKNAVESRNAATRRSATRTEGRSVLDMMEGRGIFFTILAESLRTLWNILYSATEKIHMYCIIFSRSSSFRWFIIPSGNIHLEAAAGYGGAWEEWK